MYLQGASIINIRDKKNMNALSSCDQSRVKIKTVCVSLHCSWHEAHIKAVHTTRQNHVWQKSKAKKNTKCSIKHLFLATRVNRLICQFISFHLNRLTDLTRKNKRIFHDLLPREDKRSFITYTASSMDSIVFSSKVVSID